MSPDETLRAAARFVNGDTSPEAFAAGLTHAARLAVVAAIVRAEGFCWVCDGTNALGWAEADNARALERRRTDGWALTATGCTGCDESAAAQLACPCGYRGPIAEPGDSCPSCGADD